MAPQPPYSQQPESSPPPSHRGLKLPDWADHPMDPPTHPQWWDCLMPAPAVPLLFILFFILPLAILTAESLLIPIMERVPQVMSDGLEAIPIMLVVKLFFFAVLGFLGVYQLLLRINVSYFATWSRRFTRPHPLHVDYHPHSLFSTKALFNWHVYRGLVLMLPPVVMVLLTIGCLFSELYFFNHFGAITTTSLPLQVIVGMFVFMLLCLFTVFTTLNSLWTTLTTIFGSVIAVTETDLPAKTIHDRSARIAFASPYIYGLYPAYFLWTCITLGEVAWLLNTYNIDDLLSFRANLFVIFGLELLTLVFYLIISYFRFYTYHHALQIFYHKLPHQMLEEFKSPPPAYGPGYYGQEQPS